MVTQSNLRLAYRIKVAALGVAMHLGTATALADVVAVVSSKSAVVSLSPSQIADIFLCRINRFPSGAMAVPIDQAEGSAARDAFYVEFAGKSPAQIKAFWSRIIFTGRGQPPRDVANGIEVKKVLASNPDAIGYIDEKLVDDTVRVLH